MVVVTDTGKLDELRQTLRGRREGVVEVREVRTEYRYDGDGDEYLLITLVVSDPPPDGATWPLDDVYALQSFVEDTASGLGILSDLDVTVTASGDPGTSDDGAPSYDLGQVLDGQAGDR